MSRTSTHILRAQLRPRVYRDIEIESTKSLYDLAAAIVQAFDFDFDHAFGFYGTSNKNIFHARLRYELFADLEGGHEAQSVKKTKIAQAFPAVGSKMHFLFDYGDSWRFQVEVIGQGGKVPKARYPKVLKVVGKAPPQYPSEDDTEE
jgi:hypothetical protein